MSSLIPALRVSGIGVPSAVSRVNEREDPARRSRIRLFPLPGFSDGGGATKLRRALDHDRLGVFMDRERTMERARDSPLRPWAQAGGFGKTSAAGRCPAKLPNALTIPAVPTVCKNLRR